jgi:hypothetical protein
LTQHSFEFALEAKHTHTVVVKATSGTSPVVLVSLEHRSFFAAVRFSALQALCVVAFIHEAALDTRPHVACCLFGVPYVCAFLHLPCLMLHMLVHGVMLVLCQASGVYKHCNFSAVLAACLEQA